MSSIAKSFMSDRVFLDTNVLVYAFGMKKSSMPDPRAEIAQEIVIRGAVVSVQVLNEFVQVCHRKAGLTWERIVALLQVIKELSGPAIAVTVEVHEAAVELSRRYGFKIYDSLILAAAITAGCGTLYTEDLQHGQVVEGLRIENPFRLSPTP
jgi:predicted nucleic acid-binding protein